MIYRHVLMLLLAMLMTVNKMSNLFLFKNRIWNMKRIWRLLELLFMIMTVWPITGEQVGFIWFLSYISWIGIKFLWFISLKPPTELSPKKAPDSPSEHTTTGRICNDGQQITPWANQLIKLRKNFLLLSRSNASLEEISVSQEAKY